MTQTRPNQTTLQVSGTTTLCAILADPVHHVRLPEVFNAMMAQAGSDAILVPMQVAPAGLRAAFDGLRAMRNLAGFAVTVPHKSAALALCDEASERAVAAGAVNIVRCDADGRMIGDNLDGIGFVAGLREAGIDVQGMRTFVAGAGGAARAIVLALAEAKVGSLAIWNRTTTKAEALAARVRGFYPDLKVDIVGDDPSGAELVVNATSLGLRADDPTPMNLTMLMPDQIVAEIIMKPAMTPLLRAAQERGCRICLGRPMLDCQLALMRDFLKIEGSVDL